jgi:ferritin-like metal-binding protein YciE
MNDLQKLFIGELADIYDAEQQLLKALPKMADMAHSDQLRYAFHNHEEETRAQVQRLEEVFRSVGEDPHRKSCKGMSGLIDEGQLTGIQFKNNSALDAALICAAQKVEHYEITSYGCLCTWAKELGNERALTLLKQNLSEEKATDQKLSQLAEASLNIEAIHHDTEVKGETASRFQKMVS